MESGGKGEIYLPRRRTRRSVITYGIRAAACFGVFGWAMTPPDDPDTPVYRRRSEINGAQTQLSKQLHDSGTVVEHIRIAGGIGTMPMGYVDQQIVNPTDPKLAEYFVLEKEKAELNKKIYEEEGHFKFAVVPRLRWLAIMGFPLGLMDLGTAIYGIPVSESTRQAIIPPENTPAPVATQVEGLPENFGPKSQGQTRGSWRLISTPPPISSELDN